MVNGVFWFDGRALGHGGRTRFRQHRVLRGRSVARLQRVTLLVRPRGVRQDSTTSLATPEKGVRRVYASHHMTCPSTFEVWRGDHVRSVALRHPDLVTRLVASRAPSTTKTSRAPR